MAKSKETLKKEALESFRAAFNGGVAETDAFHPEDDRDIVQVRTDTKKALAAMPQEMKDYVLLQSIDDNGNTPLHLAAKNGDLELAEILVQNGANLEAKNNAKVRDGIFGEKVVNQTPAEFAKANQRYFKAGALFGNPDTAPVSTYLDGELTTPKDALIATANREKEKAEALRLAAEKKATPAPKGTANPKVNRRESVLTTGHTTAKGPVPVKSAAALSTKDAPPVIDRTKTTKKVSTVKKLPMSDEEREELRSISAASNPSIVNESDKVDEANKAALVKFNEAFNKDDFGTLGIGETTKEVDVRNVLNELPEAQREFVLNHRDEEGNSPLHLATLEGNGELAKILIDGGAGVNAQNSNGDTALHIAATKNDQALAKILVDNGADINAQNNLTGDTALHTASRTGRVDLSTFLVDSGASLDVKNNDKLGQKGQTPLEVAGRTTAQLTGLKATTGQYLGKIQKDRASGKDSVSKLLVHYDKANKQGSKPKEEDQNVNVALERLEALSQTPDFQKNPQAYLGNEHDDLVKLQTVLNAQLGKGNLSIHDTTGQNIDEGLRGVVTKLADESNPDHQYSQTVKSFKQAIAHDTSTITQGETQKLFKFLKDRGYQDTVTKLLKEPLDLDGNTALHQAAIAGNVSLSAVLVNNGADITAKNFYENKPAEVAETTRLQGLNSLNPVAEKPVAQYLNEIEANRVLAGKAVKTLVNFHERVNTPNAIVSPAESDHVTKALNDLKKLSEQKSRAGMLAGGDVVALDFERNPAQYVDPAALPKLQAVIAGQKIEGGPYQQPGLDSTDFTALGTALDAQAKASPPHAAPKTKLKSALKSAKPEVSEAEFNNFVELAKTGKLSELTTAIDRNPQLLIAKNKANQNVFQVLADIEPATTEIESSTKLLLAQLEHHQKKEAQDLGVAAAAVDPNVNPNIDLDSLAPMSTSISSTSNELGTEEEKKRRGILVNPRNYEKIKADGLDYNKEFTGKSSGSNTKTYHDADGKGQVIETMVGEKFTFEPGHPSDSPSKVYRIEVPRLVNGEVNENVCDVLVFNSKGMLLEHIDPDPGGKKSECRLDGEWLSKKLTEREKFLAQEQASSVKVSSSTPSKSGARIISSTNAPTAEVVVEEAAEKGSTTQNGKPNSAVNHSTTVSTAAKRSTPQNGKPNSAVNHSTTVSTAGGKKVSEEGHHYGNSRVGRKGARKAREQADAEKQTMQLRSKLSGTVEHVPSGSSVHPSSSVINSKTADAKRAKGGKND